MIYGIGTDLVRVARLEQMWARHGVRAQEKLLARDEWPAFAATQDKGRFLAKRFAAKEAFAKAMGTGVRHPVTLDALSVHHDEWGKPLWKFHGQLADMVEEKGIRAHLSLSDEAEYVIAYVVLEIL